MLEEKNTVLWYFSVSGPFDTKYTKLIHDFHSLTYCQHRNADWPFYITEWNIFNFTPLQFSVNSSAWCLSIYFQAHSEILEFVIRLGSFPREPFQCSAWLYPSAHQTRERHIKCRQEAAAAFSVQLQGHRTAVQQEQDMQQESHLLICITWYYLILSRNLLQ